MKGQARYLGRQGQMWLHLKKLLRMFIYQNDWKVLPMSAVIAAVVTFVVAGNLFYTQEGTLTGSFAIVCVCIWNGFFNSIQSVCRERNIVKREHRAGLHMSAYIGAHMIYQMFLCAAQVCIMVGILKLANVSIPASGVVFRSGIVELAFTMLLITYASDMCAIMISSIVRTTTMAMTVMPFLLIFQLVFSGGFFQLAGAAEKITSLTIAKWGLNSVIATGRYNELPMVTLWNTLFKFKDMDVEGYKPILAAIKRMETEGMVSDFIVWSGTYNQNPAYASTVSNVMLCWGVLIMMTFIFAAAAVIALELIDRDTR